MMMSAEAIATALGGAQRGADGWWRALCPCREDRSPSFAVKDRADGGGVSVECFGCKREDLVAELGRRGLWPNGTRDELSETSRRGSTTQKADDWRPILPVPPGAPPPPFQHRRFSRPASSWVYNDAAGKLVGYVSRFDRADGGKDILSYVFCQAGDGRRDWRWQSFPTPRPLYNLGKLAERLGDWVLIVEGEKTASAAGELFGDHVVITSPGGSKAAATADWSLLKGRKVIIWPDADLPGRKYAADVAELVRKADAAKVVIVDVPADFPKAWDLADDPPTGWDLGRLRQLLDEAAFGKDTLVPAFTTLLDQAADLDDVAYDRQRDQLAKELGVRKSTLDAEVGKRRQERQEDKKAFLVEPPEWERSVDGAALLDAIIAELCRYLIMPEHAPAAVALWILHAHALDAFQCTPLLALLSPEKRCGKTTALGVIKQIVPRGALFSNTSSATIFRIVEKYQPTLLFDEMDTFIRDNDELRGILNSGHRRDAAFVMRMSGDEPKFFSTWGPKVVAMIGKLPSTLPDRAIEVSLKRKRPDERVTRFRNVRPGDLPDLKRKCIRWARENLISLRDAALDVSVPDGLNDLAADNWEPLLTIADRAGGEWPERARRAAVALAGHGTAEDGSIGVTLLGDIRTVFEQRAPDGFGDLGMRIPSKELAESLAAMKAALGRNGRASRLPRTQSPDF